MREAASLLQCTRQAVEKRITAGHLQTKPASLIAPNGKRPRLVLLDDLGPEAITRYHERSQVPGLPAGVPPARPAADPPATAPLIPAPLAIEPPAWAVEEAMRRLPIVEAALALKAAHPRSAMPALIALAREHHMGPSTLRQWMAAYRDRGFNGLLPTWGRRASMDPALEGFIKQTYLAPTQPLMSAVYDRAVAFCADIRHPAPSYRSVVRVCAAIDPAVKTYHRLGRKAWANTYEPILRRDYTDLAVGEMLCGDHRELDLFLQVGKKVRRPWLTAWLDLRSRRLVGWHLDWSPSSRTIALAFRHAVLACGRPAYVYMDNGKDYTSHYLNGKAQPIGKIQFDTETLGLFGMLNTGVIHALPFAARSKPIERWFRNLSDRFDRDQIGWCGPDTQHRPEKLAAELRSGQLLTLEALREKLSIFIDAYNAREHAELAGRSPAALWDQAIKEMPDPATLVLLLMKSKAVRVWNEGIKIHGLRYWASELSGVIGMNVEVRYDPADVSRLYVFHERTLLCEATTAIMGSMKVGEAQIKQKAKERKAALDRVRRYAEDVRILHSPDEALALVMRTQSPAPEIPPPAAAAVGGSIIPFVTRSDRAAREIAALPAPAPVAAPAIAVNDPWAVDAMAAHTQAMEDQLAAKRAEAQQAEAQRKAYDAQQWRLLGLSRMGGDE